MRQPYSTISVAMIFLLLGACSKTPSTTAEDVEAAPSTKNTSAIKHTPFKGLERFEGMPPWDLVKDEMIGKEIRSIVPQSEFICMDDLFNYMNDLVIEGNGVITANLNGSHADNFMEAFISVAPSGSIHIALNCPPQSDERIEVGAPKQYRYFTNDGVRSTTPKELLDWIYHAGSNGDMVVKADNKEQIEIAFEDFVQPITPANNPPEISTVAAPAPVTTTKSTDIERTPLIGNWACQSRKSDGSSFSSAFVFTSDGGFAYADTQSRMSGNYESIGPNAKVSVSEVSFGGQSTSSRMKVEITQVSSNPGQVNFNMKLVRLGTVTVNNCVSKNVAVSSPEPQQSTADIEACEYAKERCYEKSGAMVQMCLNALGAVRGCP